MQKKKLNAASVLGRGILYIILLLLTAVTLFPIVYSFFGSFKETQELMVSTSLLPKKFTLDNYIYAWKNVNFALYAMNSLIVAVAVVILGVLNTTMTAYVLSRRKFRGKKVINGLYMASMFIATGPATIYPMYNILVNTGLNNSLLGLILLSAGASAANIFLTVGYLEGISRDFDDAARIDGCSFFRIYIQIILPLMLPIITVIALLTFRGSWNNYLMPMIVTSGKPNLMTLPVAVVSLKSSGGMATMWSVILAAANISLIPIIIVYIICNKQFINGLTAGGIKG